MIRTGYIAWFVWALVLCAPAAPALAQSGSPSPSTATANSQAQADAEQSRLAKLAHRMADGKHPPAGSTPPYIDSEPGDDASAAQKPASGGTPLVGNTPLLRRNNPAEASESAGDRPGSVSWFLETIMALGVVIGLALVVRWGYARMGGKVAAGSSPVVEVLSRTAVAPRSHVMLLRVGGRVLVVSDSSAGMRTLASLEDAEEVADILGAVSATKPNSISRGFGQLLNRFSEDHEQPPTDMDLPEMPGPADDAPQSSVSGLLSRVKTMGRQGGAP